MLDYISWSSQRDATFYVAISFAIDIFLYPKFDIR